MTSKRMTRAEMIRWLGDAINTETEKPFEEIDYDFVEECGCLLDELMGKSTAMSEEEIAERIEKLKPDTTSAVRKKIGNRKLWKIVIAAAVVLCMSLTVVAVPELRVKLLNALQLDVGKSVVEDGITYTHGGKTTQYDDIDSLIAAENLDILSFDDPDAVIRVENIDHITELQLTTITLNDPTISFHVFHNQKKVTDSIISISKMLTTSIFDAYISSSEVSGTILYNAYIYHENDSYVISSSSETLLYAIINSLTK